MCSSPITPLYKRLGQHFLTDATAAQRMVALLNAQGSQATIEVGAGDGALTRWLVQRRAHPLYLVELDKRYAAYLAQTYARPDVHAIAQDFLQWAWPRQLHGPIALIGNLPYQLSFPILFHILAHKSRIREAVIMLQDAVAQRLTAAPGCKARGILSALLQTFYTVRYAFAVPDHASTPQPKVASGVVHLLRNEQAALQIPRALCRSSNAPSSSDARCSATRWFHWASSPGTSLQHTAPNERSSSPQQTSSP